jgi:hypothetical protein
MKVNLHKWLVKMASLSLLAIVATGCATQESNPHAGNTQQATTTILDKPYHGVSPTGAKVERKSAIKELAESIAKDGKAKSKPATAPSLMYHVYKGGLKQAISRLTYAFDYREVVFEGELGDPRWDCNLGSDFWITGVRFEDIAGRLLGPYSLEMDVHRPDRVVVIRAIGKGNPCYVRS